MRSSVSKIVKERLSRSPIPSLQQEETVHRYQEEVLRVRGEMEEARRGYEHQIDLLHSSVVKSKEEVKQLNLEMDKRFGEMRTAYFEFEDLRKEYHRLEDDYTKDYIGDGVYAVFHGYGIYLKANDFNNPTDTIFIEPDVLRRLINFADRVGMKY